MNRCWNVSNECLKETSIFFYFPRVFRFINVQTYPLIRAAVEDRPPQFALIFLSKILFKVITYVIGLFQFFVLFRKRRASEFKHFLRLHLSYIAALLQTSKYLLINLMWVVLYHLWFLYTRKHNIFQFNMNIILIQL